MSGFEFSLESLLDLRTHREKEAARELAEAMETARSVAEAREILESMTEGGRERLAELQEDVGRLQSISVALDHLREHVERAAEEQASARREVEELREEFGEAVRDRQALERLRERRRDEWSDQRSREAQKRLDEYVATQYGRSNGGAGGAETGGGSG